MDLFAELTPDTTILTPNRRLSATILKNYNTLQQQENKTTWPTLDVLPFFPSWLERTWQHYANQHINETAILLTSNQEHLLWEKILLEAPENSHLMQTSATAKLAKTAWETLKRWRIPLHDNRLKLTDDSRAFLSWAQEFATICKQHRWHDQNSLADVLAEKITQQLITLPQQLILVGFTELAPQYRHLLTVCETQGTRVLHHQPSSRNLTAVCLKLADTEAEILSMARWAKLHAKSSSSIGCVVPDLAAQRDTVFRIFNTVFGEEKFNVSAGKPLSTFPLIHTALQLLRLNTKTIPLTLFSSLLRSPFLGEAEQERFKRAQYDARLRHSNTNSISLNELINSRFAEACPALTKRLTCFLGFQPTLKKKLVSHEWIPIFSELLALFGWPGERSLSSAEFQVIDKWLAILDEFGSYDTLLGRQSYQAALHYLSCTANNTVFQIESPAAVVNILGLLEAADMPFERTWVMGLEDTVWPSRPKPNPFIPLNLQKQLNMPNASAERELLYCQQLTKQLQDSAHHIIFSYPEQRADEKLRKSALLKSLPMPVTLDSLQSPFLSPAKQIFATRAWDVIEDHIAPTIAEFEDIHGGVGIFKSQAECGFKAFAEYRLHAKKTEEPVLGLRKLDRGVIAHKALELIWRELRDSTTLHAKTDGELQRIITNAATQAVATVVDLASTTQIRYIKLEIERLKKLLWRWLELEKTRPAFTVLSQEASVTTTIGNLTVNFRIDRIDELDANTQLIIDYKTASDLKLSSWFSPRLDEPQLPLYCVINATETAGIAFAKFTPQKMEILGTSKVSLGMPAIQPLANIDYADASLWEQQLIVWQEHLTQLSNDFYHGQALVNPKDPNTTCRLCGLHAFCRIDGLIEENDHD